VQSWRTSEIRIEVDLWPLEWAWRGQGAARELSRHFFDNGVERQANAIHEFSGAPTVLSENVCSHGALLPFHVLDDGIVHDTVRGAITRATVREREFCVVLDELLEL
jgi:hypothetical protein